LSVKYTTKEIRNLAKKAISSLDRDDDVHFFNITEEVLSSKLPFRYLYIYGTELGEWGLENSIVYFKLLDKLLNKDLNFGYRPEFFRNKTFWTPEKIRAMILGARISIITTGLGVMVEKYPKKVLKITKKYLVDGDGWYICDGLAIALGQLLKQHFVFTFQNLVSWSKADNKWLRRAAVVALKELMKDQKYYEKLQKTLVIFDILMKDNDRMVKLGVAWMLRELTKNYENEVLKLIARWKNEENKNTKWIINHGIIKVSKVKLKLLFNE
jgi:3-methyladenine DNA glycosylase AlkD